MKSVPLEINAQPGPLLLLLALKQRTSLTQSKRLAKLAPLATIATRLRCSCLRSVLRVGSVELTLVFTTLITRELAP